MIEESRNTCKGAKCWSALTATIFPRLNQSLHVLNTHSRPHLTAEISPTSLGLHDGSWGHYVIYCTLQGFYFFDFCSPETLTGVGCSTNAWVLQECQFYPQWRDTGPRGKPHVLEVAVSVGTQTSTPYSEEYMSSTLQDFKEEKMVWDTCSYGSDFLHPWFLSSVCLKWCEIPDFAVFPHGKIW